MGLRCEPLTVTDQATRYLLCCQGLPSTRTRTGAAGDGADLYRVWAAAAGSGAITGAPFARAAWRVRVDGVVGVVDRVGDCLRTESAGATAAEPTARTDASHVAGSDYICRRPASTARQQLSGGWTHFARSTTSSGRMEALGQRVPAEVYSMPRSVGIQEWSARPTTALGGPRCLQSVELRRSRDGRRGGCSSATPWKASWWGSNRWMTGYGRCGFTGTG